MQLKWQCKSFKDLSVEEFFKIIFLREQVFVVEQKCAYQDCDHKDLDSYHLMGWYGNELVAYLRIIKPGISYKEVSIGRVVVSPEHREKGLGFLLMEEGIRVALAKYHSGIIRISAQQYLIPFYESLSFSTTGEGYLEDDIPHIEMVYGEG